MQKNIWWNRYSISFYFSTLFLILIWFIFKNTPPSLKIISTIIFLVTYALFKVKNKVKEVGLFLRFIDWLNFGIMTLFTIVYIAISLGDGDIAIGLFILFLFTIFLASIALNITGMFKKPRLFTIIISYFLVSFSFIILCGFIFSLVSVNEKNALFLSDKTKVTLVWDYIYFSATSYYTSSLGEIQPVGLSRLIMIIETALSYLFHVIILGFLIGNLKDNKEKML